MLRITVLIAVLAVAFATNLKPREYYEEKFFNWVQEHGVQARTGSHFVKMLANFANNDDIIEAHNSGNSTYTLGHNQFSHMSLDEWRDYVKLGLARPQQPEAEFVHSAPADLSTLAGSIDWTTKGAVTPVKDQGQCGSCWAFSATGALEGAYYNKYGTLKPFSEQHLVDCDNLRNGGTDMACNGGLMDSAFKWIKKNGGICSEKDYPYVSGTTKKAGTCDESKCTKDPKVAPVSYTDVTKNDANALMSALNKQPVSVAIQASQSGFQLYKSGVFSGTCGTELDHGVLAVGYGTENGQNFWNLKNSWGSSWGDKGYIKISRDVNQKGGQCGVLNGPPSYPNL